jgi:alginate O-acetyltransferase complex protein AlgI
VLAASYLFYAAASPRYCILLAGLTLANQAGAVLVHRTADERRRRWIVGATVAVDLGTLGVFKYYGFFADEIGAFLDDLGLGMPLPLLTIALPIGLSFITFQAISYVVDVKRRLLPPAALVDFALYLSFFPHVVAGPIVRAREFIPQLAKPRNPRDVAVGSGVVLIALGLVKKVALADYLARTVVDPVFGVPEAYSAPDIALAAYAYAAQIYCDFSGYTDIAIGVALLMGFVFPQNFNSPYRATSFRDFWRRWHMTLSRFLRDFLYIPLGGNRGGRWRTARNLMITMLLGGLWHGAAWGFILWGGLHGAGLVIERFLRGRIDAPAWLRWAIVFNLVVLGWILFRSENLDLAGTMLSRLFTPGPATLFTPVTLAVVVGVIGFQLLPPDPLERLRLRVVQLPDYALGFGLAAVVAVVGATVPSQGVPPFIYFQF